MTILHEAVESGDVERVKKALFYLKANKNNIKSILQKGHEENGEPPLAIAVRLGHLKVVGYFIQLEKSYMNKGDITDQNFNLEVVRIIHPNNIVTHYYESGNILRSAILKGRDNINGNEAVVRLLFNYLAGDVYYTQGLIEAIKAGNSRVFNYIIDELCPKEMNYKDIITRAIVHYKEGVPKLLEYGNKYFNKEPIHNNQIGHIFLSEVSLVRQAIVGKQEEIIALMFAKEPNIINKFNYSNQKELALYYAIRALNSKMVKFLIEQGANLYNMPSYEGCEEPLALSHAARTSNLEIFNLILYHLKEDLTKSQINEILLQAAFGANADIADKLLGMGADINHQDSEGNTILHNLALSINANLVEMDKIRQVIKFLECQVDLNPAISNNDNLLASEFLNGEKPSIFYKREIDLEKALIHAAEKDYMATIKSLFTNGVNQNKAFFQAVKDNNIKAVAKLIEIGKGKEVNLVQHLLNNSLNPTTKRRPLNPIRAVSVNYQDEETGMTPLMYAAHSGNQEIVELLLESFAGKIDFTLQDKEGRDIITLSHPIVQDRIENSKNNKWQNSLKSRSSAQDNLMSTSLAKF